ncbi:unnamed protein product [Brassicogethes aeneus]|uniref:RHD domain-containing protein n=1 Tax=Brassicogethes aeneus TaxID=1431903 RepID=A0A9P0BDC9_BRAAE|nr:unnamed protein product [Brassicogethes aeneus]
MEENDLENVVNDQGVQNENINISDVIEIIETDPDFRESPNKTKMFSGGQDITNNNSHRQPSQSNRVRCGRSDYQVKIVEQPASKALRFRYLCEGRSAGSIPGASSTQENKTYPAIKVVGKPAKKAVVVVSCVTKDAPHKPHPHNLVGREGCKKGVCTMEIPAETMSVTFTNLGIQCVKKKDIESALREREELRVDPFRTGFSHRNQPTSIDLNIVRLCFQVFLVEDGKNDKYSVPLAPVVSEPIYDKKSMNDLSIIKLSDCVSYVDGGRKDIILLCEKVAKEDIQVRFYEEVGGQIVWEALADIQPAQVHKQHAIWFKTPRYKTLDVTEAVNVHLQLRRPSDGATSESRPFQLLPLDSGKKGAKKRIFESDYNEIIEHDPIYRNIPSIKHEPRDPTPPYKSPMYPVPSPDLNFPSTVDMLNVPFNPCIPQMGTSPIPMEQQWQTPYMENNLPQMNLVPSTWDQPSTSKSPQVPMAQWNIQSIPNIPATSNQQQPINVYVPVGQQQWTAGNSGPPAKTNILDMDSQQINNSDLNDMNLGNITDLTNLSLSEIEPEPITSDSLTNLYNSRADELINFKH